MLGTAKAEDEHGNVAVEWNTRKIAITTSRDELEWLEDLDDENPLSVGEHRSWVGLKQQGLVGALLRLSRIDGPAADLIERSFDPNPSDQDLKLAMAAVDVLVHSPELDREIPF
jgi:hypothetical protein